MVLAFFGLRPKLTPSHGGEDTAAHQLTFDFRCPSTGEGSIYHVGADALAKMRLAIANPEKSPERVVERHADASNTYDARGWLIRSTRKGFRGDEMKEYEYDDLGRLLRETTREWRNRIDQRVDYSYG